MVNLNNNNVKCRVLVMRNNGILRIPTTELKFFATWIVKITDERSNTPNRSRKTNEKQLYFSETLVPDARIFYQEFFCAKLG